MKHGIGKQIYSGVGEYNGYWENGERHGEGVMIYKNKDIYSGMWKAGKKDGQGTYVFNDTGMKYVGTFKNGELVQGKWLYIPMDHTSKATSKTTNQKARAPGISRTETQWRATILRSGGQTSRKKM